MGGPVPFYEYRRPDGTTIEVMQKMSDPPLTHDPDTGDPVERVFHPIAVHFKGKGFYNTDYGTKNRQREKTAEEGTAKSESTSDAAPDAAKPATESKAVKKLDEAKAAAKK